MTELQTPECHRNPTLYVSGEEDQRAVFDYQLQVRVEELQYEVQVRL